MATISITKGWADGEILLEADLDAIKSGVETFLNTTKINDDNIQTSGITASSKLIDASISTAKLADDCVTTAKINAAAVTATELASDAVTTAKILDANVTKAKLATGARDATAASKSSDDTLDLTEDLIYVDSTSATVTVTLPAASSSSGHEYRIIKTVSANTVVIDGNASETINGATTQTMYQQYETMTIWCNGSEWLISSHFIPGTTFQPVVVRAKMSTSQAITTDTQTTLQFDSEDVDNKSAFNTGTYTFTVPTGCGGNYILGASIHADNAAGGWTANESFRLYYKVNSGTPVHIGGQYFEGASDSIKTFASGSAITALAAGDTVVFQVYQDSDATKNIISESTSNHMFIARVS